MPSWSLMHINLLMSFFNRKKGKEKKTKFRKLERGRGVGGRAFGPPPWNAPTARFGDKKDDLTPLQCVL